MDVLIIADGDTKYGASHSLLQMVRELQVQRDINIKVIIPVHTGMRNRLKNMGCDVYCIHYVPFYQGIPTDKWKYPIKYIIKGVLYWYGRMRAVKEAEKQMDLGKIDLIHSNSSREDLGALIARKYGKPFIWHIRELGLECFSFRKDYINLMNTTASEFIAVSDTVKEYWIGKGLNAEKMIRIYNGVHEDIVVKKEYGRSRKDKVKLLMLGCIYEAKGQYQVIHALGLMEEKYRERIVLDIVGGGSRAYVRKLKRLVDQYGLSSSITFLGYQKDFDHRICEYDCGIMCSKAEGFGRVTAEYMMAGLPVIASDIETNKELVQDQKTGLLYQWNHIQDLRDKIIYLLDNADELENMGKRAREYAQDHFTSKLNAQLICREYRKICIRPDRLEKEE